jgi:hypothetical protein
VPRILTPLKFPSSPLGLNLRTLGPVANTLPLYHRESQPQAISRRLLAAEDLVRGRVGPCDIYGAKNGTRTGFSPSSSFVSCQYHPTVAPYPCIIWGMNNRPVGGCSSEIYSHPNEMNNHLTQTSMTPW